jgi:hypothetical protein
MFNLVPGMKLEVWTLPRERIEVVQEETDGGREDDHEIRGGEGEEAWVPGERKEGGTEETEGCREEPEERKPIPEGKNEAMEEEEEEEDSYEYPQDLHVVLSNLPPGVATNCLIAYSLFSSEPTENWDKSQFILLLLFARTQDLLGLDVPSYVPISTLTEKLERAYGPSKKLVFPALKISEILRQPVRLTLSLLHSVCNDKEFGRYDGYFCAHSCGELYARPFLNAAAAYVAAASRWEKVEQKEVGGWQVHVFDVEMLGEERMWMTQEGEGEEQNAKKEIADGFTTGMATVAVFRADGRAHRFQTMPDIRYSGDRTGFAIFNSHQVVTAIRFLSERPSDTRCSPEDITVSENYFEAVVRDHTNLRFVASPFCNCDCCLKLKDMADFTWVCTCRGSDQIRLVAVAPTEKGAKIFYAKF